MYKLPEYFKKEVLFNKTDMKEYLAIYDNSISNKLDKKELIAMINVSMGDFSRYVVLFITRYIPEYIDSVYNALSKLISYCQFLVARTSEKLDQIKHIEQERQRQISKWGEQKEVSLHKYMTILAEEVGEVNMAYLEQNNDELIMELIQVAAVCVQIIENFYDIVPDTENQGSFSLKPIEQKFDRSTF